MSILSKLTSNQRYAIVTLILSVVYFALGFFVEVSFYNGSIGPQHWIIGVGAVLALLSFGLFLREFWPGEKEEYVGNFPNLKDFTSRLPFIAAISAYAFLLEYLGFFLLTPLLMTFVGVCFKAEIKRSVLCALIMTLACWLVFELGLGITLTKGELFQSFFRQD